MTAKDKDVKGLCLKTGVGASIHRVAAKECSRKPLGTLSDAYVLGPVLCRFPPIRVLGNSEGNLGAMKRQEAVRMLLGVPGEAADMGPSGIPEE
jgi:hypothetical protein